MPSRRVFLRTLGASAITAIAGCSGDNQSDSEATTEPGTATAYQETTIMSPIPTTVGSNETAATVDTIPCTATATTQEVQENTEETTETTEDDGNDRSYPSNGDGSPSNDADSTDDTGTTASTATTTTTEATPTPEPTTATTPTEGPPTATTETTTRQSTTATTTGTTTEQPPSGDGSWSAGPDLPTPQSNAGGGVVGGSLYCFGGIESGANLPAVARTYRFDPDGARGGTWHRLEDMPKALWAPCGVAAEGQLYSFGGAPTDAPYGTGEPPSDEIFAYTPGEGWRDLTAETGVRCPYPNWAMGGVYDPDDGLVYLVGGGTDVTDRKSASDHGVGTDHPGTYDESRVWTFDPTTEKVAEPDLARLPKARRWPTVALADVGGETCLHAICGLFGVTGPTDDNLRYRVSTGEWKSMTPAPRTGIYATNSDPVIDGTVHLTHGFFWEGDPSVDAYAAVCHAYDPLADSFRTDLPSPRRLRGGAVDAVVDGTLYVVGGHVKRYDQNGYHDCKTATETFTPSR